MRDQTSVPRSGNTTPLHRAARSAPMTAIHRAPPTAWLLLAAGALAGCEQHGPPQGGPAAANTAHSDRAGDPFVEGETCTRSDDCPRTGRCFDGRCVPASRSYRGEVLAERGARAMANARYAQGVEAFRGAEAAYKGNGMTVPANVACGLARALVAQGDRGGGEGAGDAGGPNETREATARALLACLQSVGPGNPQADEALASLSALAERGLDVAALDQPGAPLMTGRDPRPTPENTQVRLTFSGAAGQGSRATFNTLLNAEPLKREVLRCFLQWWESSHQNSDDGTIRVNYSRGMNEYEELTAPRLVVTPVDVVSAPTDGGATQHWLACSAAAIQAASGQTRWPGSTERWAETITLHVGTN